MGAHGVVVLMRTNDGRISPEMHNLVDGRTGAARTRIVDDRSGYGAVAAAVRGASLARRPARATQFIEKPPAFTGGFPFCPG